MQRIHFPCRKPPAPGHQEGMALLVVLLLLVVVMILGLSSSQIALLSERSARGDRDYQIAWQSAEAALVDAQFDIEGPGTAQRAAVFAPNNLLDFIDGCGAASEPVRRGLCLPSAIGKPVWLTVDLADLHAPVTQFGDFTQRAFDAGSAGLKPAYKPRYIIEAVPDTQLFSDKSIGADKRFVYRVTALGFGPRDTVQAVVQMIFRKD
ncbi:pilus assembly PilX family protein [Noviherbaspirillum pedocola]|uniref:Pilus assembly protein n=1 Tax=Noviherbaspirillum pedocola TaxID=2801341 RepID=A0A934SSX8_9BURK|nr:pilus assembly protein [Noviherbaspirillum pedocola]MBK4736005.1 pilus assembly protein [Noviherbaspirillum pedocola]